jgi:4-hydroxy-tetrahydrodipicolinate synthase
MNLSDGVWVALPTPLGADGGVDLGALERVVRHVVAGGVDVLVPLGTTGEAAALDHGERDAVVEVCLRAGDGRPVVVGCGHPATRFAAELLVRAKDAGADGALVVTPYYVKPTQDGLVAHYRALAKAAPGFPLVAYNVPSRTGVSLSLPALARIWELDEVVALKESSGDGARFREIGASLPAGKTLLCGDDHMVPEAAAAGARGLVSVAANVAPDATCALLRAALGGDAAATAAGMRRLQPLMQALFVESNPIPLKAALDLLGLAPPHLRLPLTTAAGTTVAALRRALAHLREPAESKP